MNQNLTFLDKCLIIKETVLKSNSKNPIIIAKSAMHNEAINMHGPEHHFLDGASFMVALRNGGLDFDIEVALEKLKDRASKMPGAMCGYWGVCGSVTSLGAVFSILDETGPLSDNEDYKDHMAFTSSVVAKMSEISGPRCCKRNAFISLSAAVEHAKEKYDVELELSSIICEFSPRNAQCIHERCPFYKH
ncbi:MAG: DUF5714 domain-containing protein [Bacilli bacterium]|nr:DUF5714 domain-containing protein [Bacilli bacterium]